MALLIFATSIASLGYLIRARRSASPQIIPPYLEMTAKVPTSVTPAVAPAAGNEQGGETELASALLVAEVANTDDMRVAAANLFLTSAASHTSGVSRSSL